VRAAGGPALPAFRLAADVAASGFARLPLAADTTRTIAPTTRHNPAAQMPAVTNSRRALCAC
jgi:hypothetical protein